MHRFVALSCVWLLACSGDDGHRQTTLPHPTETADSGSGSASAGKTPAPLTEDMAVAYFQTGDAGAGMDAFERDKNDEAKAAFTRARKTATGKDAARLDLLLGLVLARQQDWAAAAEHLLAAKAELPVLNDFISYQAARALFFAHDRDKATAQAKAVAPDSIQGADAALLLGDLLRASDDHAKIAAYYTDYLAHHENGPRTSEAHYRIAENLEQVGPPTGDAWKPIVEHYRAIMIEDPLSKWATRAHDRLVALTPKLPTQLRAFDTLTAKEHITKGMALFHAMRNPESEAEFGLALSDKSIEAADKCIAAFHKAQSRFKARDRKGAAPMFDDATRACKAAKNTDLWVKATYQAGRSYAWYDHETATARYQAARTIDPKHTYNDDAMLREAEEWTARGNDKQALAVLAKLPVEYPKGDNVAEATWRLGWKAWTDKQYDKAIRWWTKQIELVPHDDNWYGEGQPQYWIGRARMVKKDKPGAIASWQGCIREYPGAYYSLLALNRLRETDAKVYEAMVKEISTPPKDYDPKAPVFSFKPRVEYGTPGFHRAIELLKLGLGTSAEAELRRLGLTPPPGKHRVEDADQAEKLWAMAFLYDRAHRYATSHWPTRWHIPDYRATWPVGATRARWEIAYPLAFQELLARHAKKNDVPFALQIAIVREESAFEPKLESYANAVGLTQMIPPTAKDFSKGTGIAPTRENLRDPEMNVTIGSRFLGYLVNRFDKFIALVPPAYNGGPTYVKRILRARGTLATDEFIEAIGADQARNYTKRVLSTYFTYSWLYEHTIPEIPNAIPKQLVPGATKAKAKAKTKTRAKAKAKAKAKKK